MAIWWATVPSAIVWPAKAMTALSGYERVISFIVTV
jgi:hypothetical protein